MVRLCWLAGLLVLGAALLSNVGGRAQATFNRDFVIAHVRVFDGVRTLEDTQVAVSDGLIRAVGDGTNPATGLPVIDGRGSTLVPGLIDAHAHVTGADDLREALRFGVTTVLDMSATRIAETDLFALRAVANGAPDMADLRSAGFPAAAPGAHGTEYVTSFSSIGTALDAEAFVAARQAAGANYLKVMLNGVRVETAGMQNLDAVRVRALVAAAHAAGMLAVAHVETLGDVDIAVEAGIDGLMHVWRRGGANADVSRRIAARGIFMVPTLAISDGFLPEGRARLLADTRFQPFLSTAIRDHLRQSFTPPTMPLAAATTNLSDSIAAVRTHHQAGGTLLVGTDTSPGNPSAQGISVHQEMDLLGRSGLQPIEALAAATANSATAFRLNDRGRILPGFRADMLLVHGDPTSDPLAIRDIARIWKGGVEIDRSVGLR